MNNWRLEREVRDGVEYLIDRVTELENEQTSNSVLQEQLDDALERIEDLEKEIEKLEKDNLDLNNQIADILN